jgi:8-oxo-dGTP pyrophosphatase MutT (NUDIX family)
MIEKFLVNSMDMVKRGIRESDGRGDRKHEIGFRSIFQLRKMAKIAAFLGKGRGLTGSIGSLSVALMTLPQKIRLLLDQYTPDCVEEQRYLQEMKVHSLADDCHLRSRVHAHFTASAWVLDAKQERVLLIHHNKLQRWLQPGGHLEPDDADLVASARREVAEECGLHELVLLREELFDVDIHTIPQRGDVPEHLHLDLRFIFSAVKEEIQLDMSEVSAARWIPLDEALQTLDSTSLFRMVEKCVNGSRL